MLGSHYCFLVYIVYGGETWVNTHRGVCLGGLVQLWLTLWQCQLWEGFSYLRTYHLSHFKRILSDCAFENVYLNI